MFNILISNSRKSDGFTMIELIITITILSFGIIGVYNAFSPFVELAYNMPYRFVATYLAQEGLGIVKNLRDNNFINNATWLAGLTSCSAGCQADYKTGTSTQAPANQLKSYSSNNFLALNSDGFYSYDAGLATKFKRKITISQMTQDVLKVNSLVMWDYNGKSFSFETEEYLYNWY